jgi:hypothetical protein
MNHVRSPQEYRMSWTHVYTSPGLWDRRGETLVQLPRRACALRRGFDQEAELEAMGAGKCAGSKPVPTNEDCAKPLGE